MSGMFEPKSDKAARRLARTEKEEKEKRKSRIIATLVITVLLLITAVAIVINSAFIRRTLPVIQIDGVSFTTTEFEYFFNSEYMEYANFMSQFQGMGGTMPDSNRPLSSQVYNEETGETWADIIVNSAYDRMTNYVSLYNAAMAAGFKLSDEQITSIEDDMAMIGMQAVMNGFPSTESLLQQMFGSSMNEEIYRSIMEFITIAVSYNEHVRESFVYTPENLLAYYSDNKDELDVLNYRQFTVFADQTDSADFTDDEAHGTAITDAAAEARLQADTIAGAISGEDEFIAAAYEYNAGLYPAPESTLKRTQSERLDDNATVAWLLDETRTFGDVIVIDSDQGSNILFFVSRDDNNYRTAGMRQLLIMRETLNPEDYMYGEDDLEYIAAFDRAEREARERAELVNSFFTAAGKTEDALIDLMAEHSDDTTEGGYYTNITKYPYQSSHLNTMQVVPEIEEWLFDDDRSLGDSELVYTSAYGHHLLYFIGFGDIFFELIADDRMRTRDHNAWTEGLTRGTPEKLPGFILVQM